MTGIVLFGLTSIAARDYYRYLVREDWRGVGQLLTAEANRYN